MPAGRLPIPIEERFWPKVAKRGPKECWLWTGAEHGHGYGGISILGQSIPAHRVSWALAHGPVPPGKWVLHRCDTPRCVNPAHLFLGDHQGNMNDMATKGRGRLGVLTPAEALAARALYGQANWSTSRIAKYFKVKWRVIDDIVKWRTYQNIGNTPLID